MMTHFQHFVLKDLGTKMAEILGATPYSRTFQDPTEKGTECIKKESPLAPVKIEKFGPRASKIWFPHVLQRI